VALWKRKKKDPTAELRELIGDYELPSFSATAMKTLGLLRRDDSEVIQIADELRADPGLHVKVLQTVNAAGFGLRDQVTNLEHAINLLGSSRLEAVVLAVAVKSRLPQAKGLDLARFWRTSTLRACIAKSLTAKTDPSNATEAFTAAFLQDMAVPILFETRGSDYAELYYRSTEDPTVSLHEIERETYGHDHAMLGSLMAEKWGLPMALADAIGSHHHNDDEAGESDSERAFEAIRAVAPFRDEADPTEGLIALQESWSQLLGIQPEEVSQMVASAHEEANKLAQALGSSTQSGQKAA